MTHQTTTKPPHIFEPGQIAITAGAFQVTTANKRAWLLDNHLAGDWGCVDAEDQAANDYAVKHGGRMISAYAIDTTKPCKGFGENTLWIITEADRSVTTILLPDEY